MTSQQTLWKKVVYEEPNGTVGVRQGFFFDDGEYVKIIGDRTESLIRKNRIISITSKRAGNDDRKN